MDIANGLNYSLLFYQIGDHLDPDVAVYPVFDKSNSDHECYHSVSLMHLTS
jgi:hypothetical protein